MNGVLGGLLTFFEYEKLHYLAKPEPFLVRYVDKMVDELYHLDGLRYIEVLSPGGIQQIVDEQRSSSSTFDLKQYLRISSRGRDYVQYREKLAPTPAEEDWGRVVSPRHVDPVEGLHAEAHRAS